MKKGIIFFCILTIFFHKGFIVAENTKLVNDSDAVKNSNISDDSNLASDSNIDNSSIISNDSKLDENKDLTFDEEENFKTNLKLSKSLLTFKPKLNAKLAIRDDWHSNYDYIADTLRETEESTSNDSGNNFYILNPELNVSFRFIPSLRLDLGYSLNKTMKENANKYAFSEHFFSTRLNFMFTSFSDIGISLSQFSSEAKRDTLTDDLSMTSFSPYFDWQLGADTTIKYNYMHSSFKIAAITPESQPIKQNYNKHGVTFSHFFASKGIFAMLGTTYTDVKRKDVAVSGTTTSVSATTMYDSKRKGYSVYLSFPVLEKKHSLNVYFSRSWNDYANFTVATHPGIIREDVKTNLSTTFSWYLHPSFALINLGLHYDSLSSTIDTYSTTNLTISLGLEMNLSFGKRYGVTNNKALFLEKAAHESLDRQAYSKAIMFMKRLYAISEYQHEVLFDIAEVYLLTSNYDKAVFYLEKVIKIEPKFWEAYHVLGDAFINLGMKTEAKEVYQHIYDSIGDQEALEVLETL